MSVLVLLVEAFTVGILVVVVNHRYGDWHKQHVGVTIASFLSWYLPLLIVFVLPVDISTTFYHQYLQTHKGCQPSVLNVTTSSTDLVGVALNADTTSTTVAPSIVDTCHEPWLYVEPIMLMYFWRVVYWSSQFLTWLLLPMMQSFAKAGDFTILGKVKAALRDNVLYYGTYLVVFSIIFTYVVVRGDISLNPANLKVTVITAANTWGLFLVIIFMGYGLVEFPRTVWHASNSELSLRQAYFQLSKVSMEKAEHEEAMEDCLKDVQNYDKSITPSHYLRDKMMIIVEKSYEVVPERWHEIQSRMVPTPVEKVLNEKDLIHLHRRLKLCQQRYTRTHALWKGGMQSALWLEDVEMNRGSSLHQFRTTNNPPEGQEEGVVSAFWRWFCNPTVEWYWKCIVRSWVLKALACCVISLSVAVVWSECTFFVHSPPLSIYAATLQAAARHYNFLTISLISFVTIGYLCLATYYTVFHLRIFNYFQLVPNHLTDENSMIFCGMLLCRLTPPLCLNFLGLVHMDSHFQNTTASAVLPASSEAAAAAMETAYTRIMGHLDVIGFISKGFNVYFPMVVLVLCLATWLRLGTRCLHAIGMEQFLNSSDEVTQDAVEEGRILLRREKLLLNRRVPSRRGEREPSSGVTSSSGLETRVIPIRSDGYQSTLMRTAPTTAGSQHRTPATTSGATFKTMGGGQRDVFADDRVHLLAAEEETAGHNVSEWTPMEYNADVMEQYLGGSATATRSNNNNTNNSRSSAADRNLFRM